MQGYPDIRTVDEWLEDPKDRYPQSRVVDHHNKADGFERRIALYMVENFRYSMEMEDFVYGTQLMQAEALSAAYRSWRRDWKGEGKRYCGGALVWQVRCHFERAIRVLGREFSFHFYNSDQRLLASHIMGHCRLQPPP